MSNAKSFFKKTCKFTNVALKKAQGLIEMSQINLRISNLKGKIERKCAIIGALVVSKKNGGSKKLTVEQCDEKIEKLCNDIETLRQKLKKAKNEVKEVKHHLNNCSFCDDCFVDEEDDSDEDSGKFDDSSNYDDYDDFSKFDDD